MANLAEYFSECMETSVFQYCNGLLQELNAIKDSYSEGELKSPMSMISFGVMDLLAMQMHWQQGIDSQDL